MARSLYGAYKASWADPTEMKAGLWHGEGLTHGFVEHRMPGHVAEQRGAGAHDLGAAGLQQPRDAGQPLLLQPDHLAHGIGHLRDNTGAHGYSARGNSWDDGQA